MTHHLNGMKFPISSGCPRERLFLLPLRTLFFPLGTALGGGGVATVSYSCARNTLTLTPPPCAKKALA